MYVPGPWEVVAMEKHPPLQQNGSITCHTPSSSSPNSRKLVTAGQGIVVLNVFTLFSLFHVWHSEKLSQRVVFRQFSYMGSLWNLPFGHRNTGEGEVRVLGGFNVSSIKITCSINYFWGNKGFRKNGFDRFKWEAAQIPIGSPFLSIHGIFDHHEWNSL